MRVFEHFRSIQGEGKAMGIPTYFIRTAGCNLFCEWCDTKYAMDGGSEMSVEEIMSLIADDNMICLTGGEPLLQNDSPEFISVALEKGKKIVLETNGSIDISKLPKNDRLMISMDIKCPSSGMSDKMRFSNLAHLSPKDQLKFIIADDGDLEFAANVIKNNKIDADVIFSPVGGLDLKHLVEEVLERRLYVRVLPQLHKIIWGDLRSV